MKMKPRRLESRLQDPLTYVGLAAFGAAFGIKELAMLGIPETASAIAALAGTVVALFGETKDERRSRTKQAPTKPVAKRGK